MLHQPRMHKMHEQKTDAAVCERLDYYTGQRKKEGETDQICLAFSFCIPEVIYGYQGPTVRVLVACILTHPSSNKIILILCMSSYLNFQVGKCNNLQHTSSLPCSEKYLSESYLNKHDIIIDSNFQSFLKHDFLLHPCKSFENLNTVIKVPVLHRDLIGEGSHRRLFSSLRVSIQPHTTISELPEHFCEAVVIERLPSGVFADPFELQHLVQRGGTTLALLHVKQINAAVFGDTNLELPSALSNRSVVEVHMDIGHNILSKHTDELKINLELPLHARYPPLDGSGYSNVEVSIPDLFIRCSTERNGARERCFWAKRAEHVQSLADAVLWRIPSGNKAHSQIVSYVTFTAAFLSTVLIVLAAVCYSPNTSSSKSLKKLRKS
ncbi:hypothetical protein C5167_014202 [Papaver somniferum]|uniref:Phosphatidylinositol-glycan biosynthesis class X protein n=1 Tax=Papaver somniferum TaxID=3469 RepID=A0A4Y7J6H4_PAPSO|nr:hypothetical protein C5167_014202 [Papaver somniferum]